MNINHLNVRVAWHDNRWDGTVCRKPSENCFCVDLDRIRAERNDTAEDTIAGQAFGTLDPRSVPPCKAESGAFMNAAEWRRVVHHPYQEIEKARATHGHLKETTIRVPPFSSFAVPFLWMLRSSQERIDASLPQPLPPEEDSPFSSPWVFARERQEALSELFFGRLTPGHSLAFFYTKSGHPLGDSISRLVVGVGVIEKIFPILRYESSKKTTYPVWDRLFTHSIRPTGHEGFLLPYHDYLEPTGEAKEDARRRELLAEIAVIPEPAQIMTFSYAGELSSPDIALAVLVRCLEAVRRVKEHGIAVGPWSEREEWLNAQIELAWRDRGAFPGAGAVLEALGMRLGVSLMLELLGRGKIGALDDPWPVLDAILRGKSEPPSKAYTADIKAVAATWKGLREERRSLVKLLSRFGLSAVQARRWLDEKERAKATRTAVSDQMIVANPYRIVETDLGDSQEHPVALGVIDRGVFPDITVAKAHPIEPPSCVESPSDWRRLRAALVTVLRRAAFEGDALLSEDDAVTRLGRLDVVHPCVVSRDWLTGNIANLSEEVERVVLNTAAEGEQGTACLQLTELREMERRLAAVLDARAAKSLPTLGENWATLLAEAIRDSGANVDPKSSRHKQALAEQAAALERITTRRLGVLVGRAGTGKTTVLGALMRSKRLAKAGVLFLAPTGKARVRLAQKTGALGMTIAQFLYQQQRYDPVRQRPLFTGKEPYQKERTVVVDESSMLTLDDLSALLSALDLGHVERLILVGDPNQLPPIGLGRPFADLVAHLDEAIELGQQQRGGALARLGVELRTLAGAPSDALRLASWFTREPQPVDADRVLSDLEQGVAFNDLEVCFWNTPEELRDGLEAQFVRHLELARPGDVVGFNAALGLTKEGWVPFDDHDGAERFQVLSPVRMHPHGVHELNRWIQQRYRSTQLKASRQPWGLSLGDEEIVWGDKVILVRNGRKEGWHGKEKRKTEEYLANGEIGIAAPAAGSARSSFLNVAFAGRPDIRFGYARWQFSGDSAPLELAYVLTVHKAQGSEFGTVFVILPRQGRLITRELLYTALTRARRRLVLLVEGNDASFLYELTKQSETARRNTNLFRPGLRRESDVVPYAEHLIHRTTRNELVRSKSELAIANFLSAEGMPYQYERVLEGGAMAGRLRPDFSFITNAGDVIVWEHLGLLDRDDYRRGWEWKRKWYAANGYVEGETLFTTAEDPGLDMNDVRTVASRVKEALSGG
jgi:ATP-dependent exoDNAse (exonuclease V) alpha subunit